MTDRPHVTRKWRDRPMAVTQSSTEILAEADRIIHGERAQSYGSAETSFARIGKLWSAYLDVEIDAYDVAMLMTLMKVSRGKTDVKRDTAVDIAGYAALSERCAVAAGRMTYTRGGDLMRSKITPISEMSGSFTPEDCKEINNVELAMANSTTEIFVGQQVNLPSGRTAERKSVGWHVS